MLDYGQVRQSGTQQKGPRPMKQSDIRVSVSEGFSREYGHLGFDILLDNGYDLETVASIEFQCNENSREWYGPHIKMDRHVHNIEDLEAATQAIKKFAGRGVNYLSARDLAIRVRDKFDRVVYDGRENEYVPVSELADPEFKAWRDNTQRQCTVGCLARTEYEAKEKILKKFAEHGYTEKLQAWLAAGQPVRSLNDSAPTVNPLEKMVPSILEDPEEF